MILFNIIIIINTFNKNSIKMIENLYDSVISAISSLDNLNMCDKHKIYKSKLPNKPPSYSVVFFSYDLISNNTYSTIIDKNGFIKK